MKHLIIGPHALPQRAPEFWGLESTRPENKHDSGNTTISKQVFLTFLGWLSAPFKWLNDLQLGDEKVTLNHQDVSPIKTLWFSSQPC